VIIYILGGIVNKKDKNALVQYYKKSLSFNYENQRLEPCNIFYIEQIEAIADLYLKKQKTFQDQSFKLKTDEAIRLGWRIAGYLEDIVNQIGIFKALTAKNREIFGTPLPLFVKDPKHYDPDIINKQAIVFLIWDYITGIWEDFILSPCQIDLLNIAGDIFSYLTGQKKNVPHNSKLKEFFTLSDKKDGGYIKGRLLWFGVYSYLFRFYAENYLQGKEKRISTLEDFLMQKSTKISGFTPLDIFVQMIDLDKDSKEELQKWEEPYMALYYIEDETPEYWTVKNMVINKNYKVWKDYGVSETDDPIKKGIFCAGGIVPWQKDWRWSGEQVIYPPLNPENIDKIINILNIESPKMIYRYCEESRKKVYEYEKEEHDFFISYFKTNLVFFNSGYTMRDQIRQYQKEFYELKSENIPEEKKKKLGLENGAPQLDFPVPLLESNDTAVFYAAGKGISYLTDIQAFINVLEKKGQNLTKDEYEFIYEYIADPEVAYQLFHHLKKNYSFESIKSTFLIEEWDEERDFEYLLRCYKANQYKDKFPHIAMVSFS
jgi:hypothetical protein